MGEGPTKHLIAVAGLAQAVSGCQDPRAPGPQMQVVAAATNGAAAAARLAAASLSPPVMVRSTRLLIGYPPPGLMNGRAARIRAEAGSSPLAAVVAARWGWKWLPADTGRAAATVAATDSPGIGRKEHAPGMRRQVGAM